MADCTERGANVLLGKERVENMKRDLEENGVAVVPDVLSQDNCDVYVTELRSWLSGFDTGFPSNINSIINQYGIAHHPSAWNSRLKLIPVFAELWGTDKLHTSMDGIAIGRPPEMGATNFDHMSPGVKQLHLDQGAHKKGLHAYQGALYLEEAAEEDWCFLVMNKSHKLHDDYFKTCPTDYCSEFRILTEDEKEWYKERGCEIRRIAVPKGGIVLWDSRLVHAGAPPIQGRTHSDRWRFVIFVSMTPAIWSGDEDNEQRRLGYKTLRCSPHWSSQGFSLFHAGNPTRHDLSELPAIARTQEARLLAADLEYEFEDGKCNGPKWKPHTLTI